MLGIAVWHIDCPTWVEYEHGFKTILAISLQDLNGTVIGWNVRSRAALGGSIVDVILFLSMLLGIVIIIIILSLLSSIVFTISAATLVAVFFAMGLIVLSIVISFIAVTFVAVLIATSLLVDFDNVVISIIVIVIVIVRVRVRVISLISFGVSLLF